ncbi:MAG: hypothetical protein AAFY46_12450 [Planctomycetota bacterium]
MKSHIVTTGPRFGTRQPTASARLPSRTGNAKVRRDIAVEAPLVGTFSGAPARRAVL